MECLGVSQYVFKVFNLMECYSKAVSSSIVVVVVVVAAAAAAAAAAEVEEVVLAVFLVCSRIGCPEILR